MNSMIMPPFARNPFPAIPINKRGPKVQDDYGVWCYEDDIVIDDYGTRVCVYTNNFDYDPVKRFGGVQFNPQVT